MAIILKTAPVDPPLANDDWTRTQDLITMLFLGNNGPILRVVGGNIVKGSVFQIGGAIYYANSDTAITGSASDYVKITPSGATASASYVADLSGVSWNDEYNGYVDVSGNLYIFDEAIAISDGELSDYRKEDGNCVKIFGDQTVGGIKGFIKPPFKYGQSGFFGGTGAGDNVTTGGAIGNNAEATSGGAVGYDSTSTNGGAVGDGASATTGGAVGYDATETNGGGAVGASASATNGGAVGYGATANGTFRSAFGCAAVSTANNQIRIGTATETIVDGSGATITSDERDKTDIEDNDFGLEFILKVPTKKFRKNPRELYFTREEPKEAVLDDKGNIIEPAKRGGKLITDEKHRPLYDEEAHAKGEKKGNRYHRGVIAQEIEALFDTTEFSAVKKMTVNDPDAFDEYAVNYTEFIAPLIKAVQELSEEVKILKEEIVILKGEE